MKNLLDLIYPQKCILCKQLDNKYICDKCMKGVMPINVLKEDEDGNRGYIIYRYDGIIKKLIFKFKYYGCKSYYKALSDLMINEARQIIRDNEIDLIIPVPIHKNRFKERGYNQAELLAKSISRASGVKYRKNILKRNRNTISQNGLNAEQRQVNVKNCFSINKKNVIITKNILLVDDIYTTGSTIKECSKTLKGHFTGNVMFITLSG